MAICAWPSARQSAARSAVSCCATRGTGRRHLLPDDGTAAPTIGPDGDVFYGVLEANFPSNHARGWMLHFSPTLTTTKIPGAFGWDDSASIVPSGLVPSYQRPLDLPGPDQVQQLRGWGNRRQRAQQGCGARPEYIDARPDHRCDGDERGIDGARADAEYRLAGRSRMVHQFGRRRFGEQVRGRQQ